MARKFHVTNLRRLVAMVTSPFGKQTPEIRSLNQDERRERQREKQKPEGREVNGFPSSPIAVGCGQGAPARLRLLTCAVLFPCSKSKKGSAGGSRASKADAKNVKEENEFERAKAAAALWEARLEVTEISRREYREAARRLARNNEELERQQRRLEKDAVDVLSSLKKQDLEKEELVGRSISLAPFQALRVQSCPH